MDTELFSRAATLIKSGGVIAYPTEAVWGLGCDPWNTQAIETLLQIKKREKKKGLILVAANVDQIKPLVSNFTPQQIAKLIYPKKRATTWLIEDNVNWVSSHVKGDYSSVAVRISQHRYIQKLCLTLGHPIISTSANLAGMPALKQYDEVVKCFHGKVDFILKGELGSDKQASSIIEFSTGKVLR